MTRLTRIRARLAAWLEPETPPEYVRTVNYCPAGRHSVIVLGEDPSDVVCCCQERDEDCQERDRRIAIGERTPSR